MELGEHKRNNQFQVLIDSDAFIGWMVGFDAHHKQARQIFHRLKEKKSRLVTTSLVVAETATVLSHRSGQVIARTFLDEVNRTRQFPCHIHRQGPLSGGSGHLQTAEQKGDQYYRLCQRSSDPPLSHPHHFSFDKVYPKSFGLDLIGG